MANHGSREAILGKIRAALQTPFEGATGKPDFSSPIYQESKIPDLVIRFAETFTARKGVFFYAQGLEEFRRQISTFIQERGYRHILAWEPELVEELHQTGISFWAHDRQLQEVDCGISLCECLISRTGSILVSSRQRSGRRLTIYPPTHIVVASAGQMVPDIKDAFTFMHKKYGENLPSMLSMITGASRTADIEKTLVMGAHGPKELILFLIDDAETGAQP